MHDLSLLVFNNVFKFQDSVCSGCHDLMILCLNISDLAIITVKYFDYCCIIHNISKSEAVNLLKNSELENRGYENIVLIFILLKTVFVLLYIKWLIVNIIWTSINL